MKRGLLALAFSLAACSTMDEVTVQPPSNLTGENIDTAIKQLGTPTAQRPLDDGATIYEWRSGGITPSAGIPAYSTTGQPSSGLPYGTVVQGQMFALQGECVRSLVADRSGKIVRSGFRGDCCIANVGGECVFWSNAAQP